MNRPSARVASLRTYPGWVAVRVARWAFLKAIRPLASWSRGEVVLVLLGPADEDGAVAVQPGVCCLDDPPAGSPAGRAGFELDLLTAGADVRRVTVLDRQISHRRGVKAAIEAQALWMLRGRFGAFDRDAGQGRL